MMIEPDYTPLFVTLAKKKLSAKDLSHMTGVTEATISKIKKNKGSISVTTLLKIKVALDVSLDDLVEPVTSDE